MNTVYSRRRTPRQIKTLPLTGVITSSTTTIQVSNLRATSPSAGTIRGSFDQIWSSTGLAGTGRLTCVIRNITRTSGAPTFAGRLMTEASSLEDMIRRALSRF
jgi:hypothetical protein